MISFDVTREETVLIKKIADRAFTMAEGKDVDSDYKTTVMRDVTATHANGCPLRLERLLEADDFNFAHDIHGINRHLDHDTGELTGFFLPRAAAPEEK